MGRGQTVLGRSVLKESTGSRFGRARILAGLLILGVLAANVFAAAITFTGTTSLGVGSATIAGCDTDGIKAAVVSAYVDASPGPGFFVSQVSIGTSQATTTASNKIADGCAGKSIRGVVLGTAGSIGTIMPIVVASSATTLGQVLNITDSSGGAAKTVNSADITGFVFEIAD